MLLLKVVNSQAYGPDVVELVEDVTRAAQTPLPAAGDSTQQPPGLLRSSTPQQSLLARNLPTGYLR